MDVTATTGLFLGAIGLGLLHGIEPGHGWPVAASYALERSNKWLYGFAASLILGVGHLISSIAMVVVFFWAKRYFGLTQIGWMNYVAGLLLIALGANEYFNGHSHGHLDGDDEEQGHGHSHDHDHSHDAQQEHGHTDGAFKYHVPDHHDHEHGHHHHDESTGLAARIKNALPFAGGHSYSHDTSEATERGLWGIAAFAFALGFAHEEEFEIIGLCLGSTYCLELMLVYALTVIVGIVAFTLLFIAGYERYEERAEKYAARLPTFSAAVLVLMGIGFIVGVF